MNTFPVDKRSSADAELANAKKRRQSTTRKSISGVPSESRSEIVLDDIKKCKNKTEKNVAISNGKFHIIKFISF